MIQKWNPRGRIVLYLGPFPRYASSYSLVLNLDTAIVYLELHVQHGQFFEMVLPTAGNRPNILHFQQLYGFTIENPNHIQPQEVITGQETVISDQTQQKYA